MVGFQLLAAWRATHHYCAIQRLSITSFVSHLLFVTSQVIDWLRYLPIRYVTSRRSDYLLLSRAEYALPYLLGSIGCSTLHLSYIRAVHPVIDELELIEQFTKNPWTIWHFIFVCLNVILQLRPQRNRA